MTDECSLSTQSKTFWIKKAAAIILAIGFVYLCMSRFPGKDKMLVQTMIAAAAFIVFGFSQLKIRSKVIIFLLNALWGIACVRLAVDMGLPTGVGTVDTAKIYLNILCGLFAVGCLFTVTASWRLSVSISSCLILLLLITNYYVYRFRGNEFSVADFHAFGTAVNVMDQYEIKINQELYFICLPFCVLLFSQFYIPRLPSVSKLKLRTRAASLVVTLVMGLVLNNAVTTTPIQAWANYGSLINGYLLNFGIGVRNSYISRPGDYSRDTIENLELLYGDTGDSDSTSAEKPNIIVVMNESYADLSIFPNDLNTDIPVTPFIDSLSENTVKGYALSSVFGGKTPNSEFELLTGHTMGFLPNGTIAYQQYINGNVSSLPWILDSYGYSTFATHPFYSTSWARPSVYPKLGFQDQSFLEAYPQENLIRSFVSDREMFDYVLNRLNSKESTDPAFIMGITMQNHGGYTYSGENYTQTVHLEGYSQEYPQAEQYLSLVRETDLAVEHLLTELQSYPEKTVVLFFGDHQPNIEPAFYEALNGSPFDTLEEQMLQYTVPFFIWANYDIESQTVPATSINYLTSYLFEATGMEVPAYYRALSDIRETIPAINAYGFYSKENGAYVTFDQASEKEAQMLLVYETLQYNNLFDSKNKSSGFFTKYLP